jgi:hypothetical protein
MPGRACQVSGIICYFLDAEAAVAVQTVAPATVVSVLSENVLSERFLNFSLLESALKHLLNTLVLPREWPRIASAWTICNTTLTKGSCGAGATNVPNQRVLEFPMWNFAHMTLGAGGVQ